VTETLERIPARWVVLQTMREKFSCAACETITETPAPFHAIPRGRAGPHLLAEITVGKFGGATFTKPGHSIYPTSIKFLFLY
jgi:transposase